MTDTKPLSPEEWETIRALRSGKAVVNLVHPITVPAPIPVDFVEEGWLRFCEEFKIDMDGIHVDDEANAHKKFVRAAPRGEVAAREAARKALNL